MHSFIGGMHALRPSGPVSDAAASVVSHGSRQGLNPWHPQLLSRLWTASYQLAKSLLTAWNFNMAGHRFDMRGLYCCIVFGAHLLHLVGRRIPCSNGASSSLFGCIMLCRVNRVLSS